MAESEVGGYGGQFKVLREMDNNELYVGLLAHNLTFAMMNM